MILFKPIHVPLILSGKKTETRRIWKRQRVKVGSIHKGKIKMLSKEYFAKLRILDVWKEELGRITNEGAVREGYKDVKDYLRAFARINGTCSLYTMVFVVEFEVVSDV